MPSVGGEEGKHFRPSGESGKGHKAEEGMLYVGNKELAGQPAWNIICEVE